MTKERRCGRSPTQKTLRIIRGGGVQSFRPTHPAEDAPTQTPPPPLQNSSYKRSLLANTQTANWPHRKSVGRHHPSGYAQTCHPYSTNPAHCMYHHLPHQPRGLLPPSCRLTSWPPTPHIYYPQALLQPQPQSATCNTCFEMYGISCNRQPGHWHCTNRNVAKHSRRASCSSKTTRPLAEVCPYWQVSGCSRAWCTCTAHANKSISQMESLSLRMTHRLANTNKIRVAFSMRGRHNIQEWVHNDSAKAKWGKKCSAHHQPCS